VCSASASAPLAAASVVRATIPPQAGRTWVRVGAAATRATILVNGQIAGTHVGAWTPFEFEITRLLNAPRAAPDNRSGPREAATDDVLEIRTEDCIHTTDGFLPTLGVRWTGVRDYEIRSGPTPIRPAAVQRSAVSGTKLLVDGRPLRVRGILHWGYYQALGKPWPDDVQMRREIVDLKALGFNLIKFCLWVPPPRYFELCDELDMLVWQEYPVWNMPLEDPSVLDEYREFFVQDRPYPCIILRSMTCENDRVSPEMSRALVDLAHEMIPGSVVLDNSGWLCNEHCGDFHDEHPYLHNAQWVYYGRRMKDKLTKPLLLGETMVADTLADGPYETALNVRRFQIETLVRDLPDAGYVICGLRDLPKTPLGLFTHDGRAKYTPPQWAWHALEPARPREIPPVSGRIIGPRKGQWKCPENPWWSPIINVLDSTLPTGLIEREAVFELLSGRVLSHADGTRVLVELWDLHSSERRTHPLVIECCSGGEWRIASALRHDTPAGRLLWDALVARRRTTGVEPPPEIGPLKGTSIVLEDWEMSLDRTPSSIRSEPGPLTLDDPRREWIRVKCDTPLVNDGRNVFEGWATFRSRFAFGGGACVLRCEAVGDYYEVYIDGRRLGEAGPRHGTWDGTRDIPREFNLTLTPGEHEIMFRVRDWRAAGGMVGPVFLATDLNERIF
jgi:hypothetical protein